MGACDFTTFSKGKNAEEAFQNARERALQNEGDDYEGYSGTIAEKHSFVMIAVPSDFWPDIHPQKRATEYAYKLMTDADRRIDDKWGPAGCIRVEEGAFLFFGYASS